MTAHQTPVRKQSVVAATGAISSSGQSADILNAVTAAQTIGIGVISLSGFKADNPLRRAGDLNFYIESTEYGFVEISHLVLCYAILDRSEPTRLASRIG
jgi:phosphoheptose isomerase